jgi:hypothetical protein
MIMVFRNPCFFLLIGFGGLAQFRQDQFRKPQVVGSIPIAGSIITTAARTFLLGSPLATSLLSLSQSSSCLTAPCCPDSRPDVGYCRRDAHGETSCRAKVGTTHAMATSIDRRKDGQAFHHSIKAREPMKVGPFAMKVGPFEGKRRTICAVRDILHPCHKRHVFITPCPIDLGFKFLRQPSKPRPDVCFR